MCRLINPDKVECKIDGVEHEFTRIELLTASDGWFWGYLLLYIFLVLFAGLMSGLTMGLLSLDPTSLEVLRRGGKPKEQRYAARIVKLVKRHHLLLVTLLIANACAVEAMPVFLGKLTHEVVAIVVSVTAVLLFGEIIPQALCTRFGLAIGYYCAPLVLLLLALFYPIAFPLSILLDWILGKGHGTFFRRAELRELVKMHANHHNQNEEPLTYDEVLIVKGALEMRDKTVGDAMTPLESVFMLDINGVINRKTMTELIHRGHSRVPVYKGDRGNVVGMLLIKKLIQLDPDDNTPISMLEGSQTPPPSCLTTMPMYDLLNHFQTGRSHLSLVYSQETDTSEPELEGIITLEDVIEELIGEEIIDETDLYVDVHQRIAVARARLQYQRQSISDPEQLRGAAAKTKRKKARRSHSYAQGMNEHARPVRSASELFEEQSLSSSVPSHVGPKLIPIPEVSSDASVPSRVGPKLIPIPELGSDRDEEEEAFTPSTPPMFMSDKTPLLDSDSS